MGLFACCKQVIMAMSLLRQKARYAGMREVTMLKIGSGLLLHMAQAIYGAAGN